MRAPRLFEELNLCHADGSFRKRLAAIAKINVLLIDDFAIAPIGPREYNDLLELLDDRVGARACIITSQLPIKTGMTISAIPRWPMQSSIASFITHTKSIWKPRSHCAAERLRRMPKQRLASSERTSVMTIEGPLNFDRS